MFYGEFSLSASAGKLRHLKSFAQNFKGTLKQPLSSQMCEIIRYENSLKEKNVERRKTENYLYSKLI